MSDTSKTYSDAKIYGVGIILRHMVAIIMLPIYTSYLTPADYGLAELLAMGVEILGLIVGVVGGDALIRLYYESEDRGYRNKVASTASVVSISFNLLAFIFIVLTASHWEHLIFEGSGVENGEMLVIMYGASLVFQVMSGMPGAYIRAIQKPKLYLFFSMLRLIVAVSANLYFVVYKGLHIEGVVYAVFTFTLIDGLILTTYMLSKTGVGFSVSIARNMMFFSFPLLVSSIALFIATYLDRILIKEYVSLTQLGIYALAYKFAFMLTTLSWQPIQQSWDVRRFEVVKLENAIDIFQTTFRQTQLYVVFVALAFMILTRDALRIMSDPAFHEAYIIVAILIPAYVIKIWSNFCFFGVFYTKKTKYKAYIEWASGTISVGLFFLLIPQYEAVGAAVATMIAFSIRFFMINFVSKKLYDMQLEWGYIAKIVSVAAILVLVSYSFNFPVFVSVIFNIGLLLGFVILILVLPILPHSDKKAIITLLKYPIKLIKS